MTEKALFSPQIPLYHIFSEIPPVFFDNLKPAKNIFKILTPFFA